MAKFVSFFGRLLLALIFITSGLDKFSNFDAETGGPSGKYMAPKMDAFREAFAERTGIQFPLQKEQYPYIILASAFLEVVGSVLFVADSSVGALMLMVFLIGATPVMHNFWDVQDSTQISEMINFMKNLSIFGGLLAYTAARREAEAVAKYKED
ncbi:unnamed protein product [Ostreobium quekettii]|uniref:DoxX family protein n=1 Tax=Ostreobium quekettii TaxID=121088 RepID=A0A8S1JDP1_9CHLO|nr:unnamed protein product [Ostreobium quekettii]